MSTKKERLAATNFNELLGLDKAPPAQVEAKLKPGIPDTEYMFPVDVFAVDFYNRNPRQQKNPAYDDIKESIRAQGVKQPLVITQRPSETRWMLKHGGNTRLQILRELYDETKEARFLRVMMKFEPWVGETDILVSHIIENEVRGNLSFIDKSRALRHAADLLEAAAGKKFSMRELSESLKNSGYKISPSLITQCFYALGIDTSIPQALAAGLGKHQIIKVRQLEAGAREFWKIHAIGTDETFRAMFTEALAKVDGPEWKHERAWRSVEESLSSMTGIPFNRVATELESIILLNRRHLDDNEEVPKDDFLVPGFKAVSDEEFGTPEDYADLPPLKQRGKPAATSKNVGTGKSSKNGVSDPSAPGAMAANTPADASSAQESVTGSVIAAPVSMRELKTYEAVVGRILEIRERMPPDADTLFRLVGLENFIRPCPHGAGFLVVDVPPAGFLDRIPDPESNFITRWIWWVLASISQSTELPREMVEESFPPGCRMLAIERLKDDDARFNQYVRYAGDVDPITYGLFFLAHLDDKHYRLLLRLQSDYRELTLGYRMLDKPFHTKEV